MKKNSFLFLLYLFLSVSSCFSQYLKGKVREDDLLTTSLRDVGIIGGTSIVGALMGASTLSFVENPKDHVDRILIGSSLGLIIGVGVVIYLQATKSTQIYNKHSSSLMPKNNVREDFVKPPPHPFLTRRMEFSSPLIQHLLTF